MGKEREALKAPMITWRQAGVKLGESPPPPASPSLSRGLMRVCSVEGSYFEGGEGETK